MAAKLLICQAVLLVMVSTTLGRRIAKDVSELKGYHYEKPSKPFLLPPPVEVEPIKPGISREPLILPPQETPTHLPQEIAPHEEDQHRGVIQHEPEVVPQKPEETTEPETTSEPEENPGEIVQKPTHAPEEKTAETTEEVPEVETEGDGSTQHEEEKHLPSQKLVTPEEKPDHIEVQTTLPSFENTAVPVGSSMHHPEEYLPPVEEEGTSHEDIHQKPENPNENIIVDPEEYLPPEGSDERPSSEYGTPIGKPCNVKSGRINCEISEPEVPLEPAENNEYLPPEPIV